MNLKEKLMLLPLVLVLILSSCSNTQVNRPPVVKIDSISPTNPCIGDDIVFKGHAKDEDGQIVSYEWHSSIDGVIGKTASFKTNSLSEGDHYIYFRAYDDDGASSEAEAKLSISAQPAVQPPESPPQPPEKPTEVTAQVAEEEVIENVLEPLTFEGPVIGFKLKETLKPGDTIAPYGGEKRQIEAESYFYFIDLYPGAFYAHDVLFAFVNKETGDMGISAEEWWPVLNDEPVSFVENEEEYWNGDNWFYSRDIARRISPQEVTPPPQLEAPAAQQQYREAAVLVNGWAEGEALRVDMVQSKLMMRGLFRRLLSPEDIFEIESPYTGHNTPPYFFDLLESVSSEGYDHVTVYIVAHGGIDCIKMGGLLLEVDDLVDFIAEHPDTGFSFLLQPCHSGSFIDDLKELPNVYLVLSATSVFYSAYGDIDNEVDPNATQDAAGEWTSSMYFGALELLCEENWANISAEANRLDVPPTVVLFLTAFSNISDIDGLDLDAAYLSDMEFPQFWSPWARFCDLWQRPPLNGEAQIEPAGELSGIISSDYGVSTSYPYAVGVGDTRRAFVSFAIPHDMPEGSTMQVAWMSFHIRIPSDCESGYLGDMIIDYLPYGELDADDFGAPSEQVARLPVHYSKFYPIILPDFSVKPFLQRDFDSGWDYSQYRVKFFYRDNRDLRLEIDRFELLIHYELR